MLDSLIVALDFPEMVDTLNLAMKLRGHVAWVKVGQEGFIGNGPTLVYALKDMGFKVFLDLKLIDIPRTVVAGATQAAKIGVDMLTVHSACGRDAVKEAVDACSESDMDIIGVTLLTSLDRTEGSCRLVRHLASEMLWAGTSGIVCSGLDLKFVEAIDSQYPNGKLRITPGIRRVNDSVGDQKAIMTPKEAIEKGATHLVIGRPITQATDPIREVELIADELNGVK